MHPEIISLGPVTIRSYGLMLAIGFMAGILVAARRARKMGEDPDHVYNLSIWIVISSLLGARIYYVMTHYAEFRAVEDVSLPARIFIEFRNMFWPVGANGQIGISGLILYGGLIAATAVSIIYLKAHHLKVSRFTDILAPSLGLGEFFTRIGCFLNGCCYGVPTDSCVGVVFPHESAAGFYFPETHLHPAQLYNSFAGLAIFLLLLYLERYKHFDGFTSLLYFMLYSAGRFSIDFFRYYEREMVAFGLSQNQIISIVVFLVSFGLFLYMNRKNVRPPDGSLSS